MVQIDEVAPRPAPSPPILALPSIGACIKAEERLKENQMASKLYVGGLSYSTTSETLREYFAQCGTVESAAVITDKFSGQSRGFGFVEMATAEEAQRAISELNGKDLDGRKLTVNLSTPKAPGSGGGPRGGGGRPGGRPGGGGRGGGFGGGDRGAYGVPPSKKPFKW
jgi:RNA recognition motif-containing protein